MYGLRLRPVGLRLSLFFAVLLLWGCGTGAGQLKNKQVALSEISAEDQPIVVTAGDGSMRRVALDGSEGVGAKAGALLSSEEGDLAAAQALRPKECSGGPEGGGKLILEFYQGNARLSVSRVNGQLVELVVLAGDKGGTNLLEPPIQPYFFSDTCELVVFGFDGQIWVVEVDSRRVSPLAPGVDAFTLARTD
ncbi:hypothetical protein DN745_16780 [Bradymonas sediminis]|uniref:Uncharacterized protein n=2 Tax=Bradymonas sediminis TaxID=1548548 RepID=A0A2Z4FPE0_9DELT|nr:hypothetical protein DN745_16780 [Bradymonas sediminis]